jgi:hypothetical protein
MYQCLMKLVELHSMTVEVEHPVPDPKIQVFSQFILQSLPFLPTRHGEARSCWCLKLQSKVAIIVNLRAVAFHLYAATRMRSDSTLNPKYKIFWTCDEDRLLGITHFGTPSFASHVETSLSTAERSLTRYLAESSHGLLATNLP